MKEVDAVTVVIKAMKAAGLPFLIVGSLASNAYGIPHSTSDVDFVVRVGSVTVNDIMRHLPEGFRMGPAEAYSRAITTRRWRLYCDIVDTPFMFDFFESIDDAHEQMRFLRQIATKYAEYDVLIPRAEDVVIAKLRWGKWRYLSKYVDDARDVLAVQMGRLDMEYIRGWCDRHGTRELLEETLRSIPPLPENS